LLPNTKFFDFVQAINKVKERFVISREYFKENLPLYKTEGMMRMGTYAEDVYPKVENIDKLFQLEIMIRPCPNSGDIRVDVPYEVLREIRNNSEEHLKADVTEAVKDIWIRFNKHLSHLSKQLNSADPKKFRSSMIKNVEDMINIIPLYNLTDDPDLEKKRKEAKQIIDAMGTMEDIKEDENIRREAVDKLTDLLNKFPEL
jgi:hypothetical protein